MPNTEGSTEGATEVDTPTTSSPECNVDLISSGESCCVPIGPSVTPSPPMHVARRPNRGAKIASSKLKTWQVGCF